ncbi:MAG: PHP domain-containing protein [Bacillota bacterium]|nr:PHP domain-containing protein [Bacillota bacterium]
MQLIADYHTHSVHSHGTGTVEENVAAARRRGLWAVAITDHGPANLFGLGMKAPEVLLSIQKEIQQIEGERPDIRVLAGVEANIVSGDGDLDVPDDLLRDLDVVLVGLHPMVRYRSAADALRLGFLNLAGRASEALYRRGRETNTRALEEAVTRHEVDIVSHPGLHLSIDTERLAAACAAVGTALEISAGHRYMTPEFVHVARAAGAVFAINSDAHRPEDVGNLEQGLAVAEAADLPAALVLNARHG